MNNNALAYGLLLCFSSMQASHLYDNGVKMLDSVVAAHEEYKKAVDLYEKCKKEKPVAWKKCEDLRNELDAAKSEAKFYSSARESWHGDSKEADEKVMELEKKYDECRHFNCNKLRDKTQEAHKKLKKSSHFFKEWLTSLEK